MIRKVDVGSVFGTAQRTSYEYMKLLNKKVVNLIIAVPRSYKNKDDEYETDFLDCTFWNYNADYVSFINFGNIISNIFICLCIFINPYKFIKKESYV